MTVTSFAPWTRSTSIVRVTAARSGNTVTAVIAWEACWAPAGAPKAASRTSRTEVAQLCFIDIPLGATEPPRSDLDHHPSLHVALQDAGAQLRQILQPDRRGHAVEQRHRQVADDPAPGLP